MSNGRILQFVRYAGLLVVVAPVVSACGSLSDFSMKDQQWFARTDKLFNQSTIEVPPLTSAKPLTGEDMMSPDGACSGMSAPVDANASAEAGQTPAAPVVATGAVALGRSECDIARAMGIAPDNVNFSTDGRGERVALVTYMRGPRPGAYTFTAGRLTSVEKVDVPEPVKPARQAKPKKKPAAT